MAGDGRVASGGDAEDPSDRCPDQTSLTDGGRAAIGFGANTKHSHVYTSQ